MQENWGRIKRKSTNYRYKREEILIKDTENILIKQ